MMRRATPFAAAAVSALALSALLAPTAAWAHGGDRAFVLLLPTGYYLLGGTLAVAATFLLLALIPKGISDRLASARLPLLTLRLPSPIVTSLLSFLFLAFLLATGFYGSRDPLANPLPLTIWTLWWVGFTLATAVLGNLWAYVNPWTGPYRLVMLCGRAWSGSRRVPSPSRRRRASKMWGRDRVGGIAEPQISWFPPPLAPPHVMSKTGRRGIPLAQVGRGIPSRLREGSRCCAIRQGSATGRPSCCSSALPGSS